MITCDINANGHDEGGTLFNDLNFYPLFPYFLAVEGKFDIQGLHISLTSGVVFRAYSYCKCQPLSQGENEILLAFYTFFVPF